MTSDLGFVFQRTLLRGRVVRGVRRRRNGHRVVSSVKGSFLVHKSSSRLERVIVRLEGHMTARRMHILRLITLGTATSRPLHLCRRRSSLLPGDRSCPVRIFNKLREFSSFLSCDE